MTSLTTSLIGGTSSSVALKAPVRAATTANITLSAEQTIDGIAIVADDRVLVKNQTDTTENGIYIASTSEWTRALDFDGARDVVTGTMVFVVGGSTNGATRWYVSTAGDPSPGSATAFTKFTGDVGDTGPQGPAGADGTVDLSSLANETTIDPANDELLMRDADESANNAVTVQAFWNGLNSLTAETAVDKADSVALYDATGTATDKTTVANFLKATTSLTDTTITASDEILFCDVGDSNNAKKDTVQGILDLVPSASGGWIPIATVTASNDTTVDFVNGSGGVVLDDTYKAYVLFLSMVAPATDDVTPYMRSSTNTGSSFDSGTNNYAYDVGAGVALGTEIRLTASTVGNAATESINGYITIFDPSNTSKRQVFSSFLTHLKTNGDPVPPVNAVGLRAASADIDAIRFLFSSGNIASGTFTLYGLASA